MWERGRQPFFSPLDPRGLDPQTRQHAFHRPHPVNCRRSDAPAYPAPSSGKKPARVVDSPHNRPEEEEEGEEAAASPPLTPAPTRTKRTGADVRVSTPCSPAGWLLNPGRPASKRARPDARAAETAGDLPPASAALPHPLSLSHWPTTLRIASSLRRISPGVRSSSAASDRWASGPSPANCSHRSPSTALRTGR